MRIIIGICLAALLFSIAVLCDGCGAERADGYSECRVITRTHQPSRSWTSYYYVGTPGKGGTLVPQIYYEPEQWGVMVEVDGEMQDAKVSKEEWAGLSDGDVVRVYEIEGLLFNYGYEAEDNWK